MNHKNLLLTCCAMLLLLLTSDFAAADEVRMKNGDRLSGEIIRMEHELLIFRTTYAEEKLGISWKEVDCIVSGQSLPTEFINNEFIIGTISCPESGKLQVESEILGKSNPTPLNQLLAVNPATYSGALNFGGSIYSGNTDSKAVNTATRFQIKTHKHRFTVEGKYNYGETDGKTSIRNSLGSLKYDLFATKTIYSYAQSLSEQDSFANLNLRNTEGLGLGYQFFDTRLLTLFTEAGISYFNEDVKDGEDNHDASARWAAGLEWEAIPKRLKLFHRQEGYYRFSFNSVVLRMDQGFRMPLFDTVAANFEFDYRYNSSPEADKKKSDLYLILGVTYEYANW